MSASAELVPEDDLDAGIKIFSRKSESEGLPTWSRESVEGPAKHRLYRAVASEHFALNRRDERVRVDPAAG